jgi:hypothetical protein
VPSVPGGGTVVYVSPTGHNYHPDPEVREEGGTPAIVGSIRAGMVFALKEAVGADEIRRRDCLLARRAVASLRANPNLRILGDHDAERLAIVSLGVRHPRGLLHPNFVVALLNDLFGIQARSGCFCAGPYLHRAYPVDDAWADDMRAQAVLGRMGAKLAFVRLSFNPFISEDAFDYVLHAVHLVADEGWKLLPLYRFDADTGLWHHHAGDVTLPVRLRDLLGAPRAGLEVTREPDSALARHLDAARRIIRAVEAAPPTVAVSVLPPELERRRWFPLPGEGLQDGGVNATSRSPVTDHSSRFQRRSVPPGVSPRPAATGEQARRGA